MREYQNIIHIRCDVLVVVAFLLDPEIEVSFGWMETHLAKFLRQMFMKSSC